MTNTATEASTPAQGTDAPPADAQKGGANGPDAGEQVDWKAEARKWEARSKENAAKAKEYEKAQQASMTEAERAVAEAEARGRTAAVQEYGKRLATSEIRATAANEGADLAGVFDYLDLGRFVGDDGEPDEKAIKAFVNGLPKKTQTAAAAVDLDLGTRGTPSSSSDMNSMLRKATGRA